MALTRTDVPVPFGQYAPWDAPIDPAQPLTAWRERLVLSAFPRGARVTVVRLTHRDYTADGFPIWVTVASGGAERTVLLRMDRASGGIEREAALLPVLARLGLPVPPLLAGPSTDPDHPNGGAASVIGLLPGTDLQAASAEADGSGLGHLIDLVLGGIDRLHALTDGLARDPVAAGLARVTLADELSAIERRGGPWLAEPVVAEAVDALRPRAASDGTPLVFSGGDDNPGNFLADGGRLSGFVDFALARFEDPHWGVTKYRVYDLHPFHKGGLVERYRERRRVSDQAFALRLAVRCLWTLQREIPVEDHEQHYGAYRRSTLRYLRESLDLLDG